MDEIIAGRTDDESFSSHSAHEFCPWLVAQILEPSDSKNLTGEFRFGATALAFILFNAFPDLFLLYRFILVYLIFTFPVIFTGFYGDDTYSFNA